MAANAQAGASRQLRRAQAAAQAAFKDTQAAAAALDAEHLQRQAILADRVRSSAAGLNVTISERVCLPAQCSLLGLRATAQASRAHAAGTHILLSSVQLTRA